MQTLKVLFLISAKKNGSFELIYHKSINEWHLYKPGEHPKLLWKAEETRCRQFMNETRAKQILRHYLTTMKQIKTITKNKSK